MHDKSHLEIGNVCTGRIYLHDHDGHPMVQISLTGCDDTPSEVDGGKGICLFANVATDCGEPIWQHFGSVGLSAAGGPVLGLTMGGEHLKVDFCRLQQLLGGEKEK